MHNTKNLYCLTENGYVQLMEIEGRYGLVFARGRKLATKVARKINADKHTHVSPALIGSIDGETVEGLIEAHLCLGIQGCYVATQYKGRWGYQWWPLPDDLFVEEHTRMLPDGQDRLRWRLGDNFSLN